MDLHRKGHSKKAIPELKLAVSIDPEFASAFNNLGVVYQRLKRYSESEKAYKHALDLDPFHPHTLSNLHSVLRIQQRWDEANALEEHLVATQPTHIVAKKAIARSLYEKGMWNEAYDALEKMLQGDAQNAYLHLLKANTCYKLHRMAEAEEEYKVAIQCDPSWIESYVCLSEFYCRTNQNLPRLKAAFTALGKMVTGKGHT